MNSDKDSRGLGTQQRRVVDLLLQVCDNAEIASQLKMARRTVLE
jgi:DNA-binding NarL/FixJ family response regulator